MKRRVHGMTSAHRTFMPQVSELDAKLDHQPKLARRPTPTHASARDLLSNHTGVLRPPL